MIRELLTVLPLLGLLACGGGAPLKPDGAAGAAGGGASAAGGAGAVGGGGGARADAAISDATDGRPEDATLPDGGCVVGAFKRGGVCVCGEAPTVCGEACVDLTSDPDNCGACRHACAPTAPCNAGACGPPTTNVAPAAPGCQEINLAVGATTLYWTDRGHGTVMSKPVAGGTATTIASHEANPWRIALSATDVFWIDVVSATPMTSDAGVPTVSSTATLRAASLAGGAPRDLVTETNLAGGIQGLVASQDGRTLYYAADAAIRAVPVVGGPAFDVGLEDMGYAPAAIARDGSLIAFAVPFAGAVDVMTIAPGVVASCGKTDPADQFSLAEIDCTRATRGGPDPLANGLVLRSDGVYWAENDQILAHRPPDGGTLAVDGSTTQSVYGLGNIDIALSVGGNSITAVAGGPDRLYFGESGTFVGDLGGLVEKVPYIEGSAAVVISRGQASPGSIAVGATTVFWSSPDDCAINGVAR